MLILPLTSPAATLEIAGGKGASLACLARLGLPVPPAFIITTEAYRRYVAANNLDAVIAACMVDLSADNVRQLENVSACIRTAFSAGRLPEDLVEAVAD